MYESGMLPNGPASCWTVTAWPAIVSVATCATGVGFGATTNPRVAFPMPERDTELICIQDGTPYAPHWQSGALVAIRNVPIAPEGGSEVDGPITVAVHGPASCVVGTLLPAMVTVPERFPKLFTQTNTPISPEPVALPPDVI